MKGKNVRKIKFKQRVIGAFVFSFAVTCIAPFSINAAQKMNAEYKPSMVQISEEPGKITNKDIAEGEAVMNTISGPLNTVLPADTELFVTVEGKGLRAKVSAYKREIDEDGLLKDSFELEFSTDEAYLGRQGLGKEKEGDDKTPVGLFKMNTPFGIKDREEGFPDNYLKLDDRYYWNGDSESDRYNKLVNIEEYQDFNKKLSEHLVEVTTCYDYAVDTGYNIEGTPYKGSALFLHCERGINTAGCIAIKEEYMKEVLRLYREGRSYIMVIEALN